MQSVKLTQGRTLQLVKLDISFWGYYLLLGLSIAVSLGDMILSGLSVTLSISPDARFFLFFVLGTLCQGVLQWQCRGRVTTTYALAYRALGHPPVIPQTAEPLADVL